MDDRQSRNVKAELSRRPQLRHQANIRHRDGVSNTVESGSLRHQGFVDGQSSADPVQLPTEVRQPYRGE